MTSDRAAQISAFLDAAGWGDAQRSPVPGDASSRRYERLSLGERRAVLMDAPQNDNGPSDYAQAAKLSDGEMAAFIGLAKALSRRGFSAPNIFAQDIEAGLLLLEDLGDDLYARVLDTSPALEPKIYGAAMDVLGAIYRSTFDPVMDAGSQEWRVRAYDDVALLTEVDLMSQWYLPHFGAALSAIEHAQWHALWREAFTALSAHAPGLVLRDFHAENIFWLPKREATARVGLIDFQDALMGHPAYDLVSLVEDARRDVDPSLTDGLISRFCEAAKIDDDDRFRAAYAVMGAQRNAKILGIFVRLSQRDGKPHYLDLIPRVKAHFTNNLSHPALQDLARFLKDRL